MNIGDYYNCKDCTKTCVLDDDSKLPYCHQCFKERSKTPIPILLFSGILFIILKTFFKGMIERAYSNERLGLK